MYGCNNTETVDQFNTALVERTVRAAISNYDARISAIRSYLETLIDLGEVELIEATETEKYFKQWWNLNIQIKNLTTEIDNSWRKKSTLEQLKKVAVAQRNETRKLLYESIKHWDFGTEKIRRLVGDAFYSWYEDDGFVDDLQSFVDSMSIIRKTNTLNELIKDITTIPSELRETMLVDAIVDSKNDGWVLQNVQYYEDTIEETCGEGLLTLEDKYINVTL